MNRTDRLYAVTEELRRCGRTGTSGPRLARLLEVSERTIKRDVAALQQAGVPIWAQAGPGGGYVLDASASLPPVNFTPAQAVAVAVALAALPAGSPFTADGAAARGKVFDALSPADRERARALSARVWLDPGTRTSDEGPAEVTDPAVLRAVEQAVSGSRVLALTYRSGRGAVTRRAVEPIILAHTRGVWYLVAWCRERLDVRWFHLARVERADLTQEQHPPHDVATIGAPPQGAGAVTWD